MVDIHSHILFGLDDGSKTIEESLSMIRNLKELGFKDLILTPHYRPSKNYVADRSEREKKIKELRQAVKKENISVNLYLGTEFDISDDLHNEIMLYPTMNDKKVILLDCLNTQKDLSETIHNLTVKGYQVIIAHVERMDALSIDYIQLLKNIGVKFQLNLGSLSYRSGFKIRRRAKKLIKLKLIDFIGSDLHNVDTEDIERGLNRLKKLSSGNYFKLISHLNALHYLL